MLRKLGVDSSVAFTILAKTVQGAGGVAILLMVTQHLDKNEQGYYYTFGSILSLQIFVELGLMGIVTQFVAHEAAHLSWKNQAELEGKDYYVSRLASIVRLSLCWGFIAAVVMIAALVLTGTLFFSRYNSHLEVSWQSPWLVLCTAAAFILLVDVVLAILEGLGQIKVIAKLRFAQQVINLSCAAAFLTSGLKLLSGGLALLISTSVIAVILLVSGRLQVIRRLWSTPVTAKVDYRKEVAPYQFRIALSYASGYFIYQFINPILFATQGPVVAGKMGATLAVLNGILVISISFFSTKVALFSSLVAKREFAVLNHTYRRSLLVAAGCCLTGLLVFMGLLALTEQYYPKISERFLRPWPVVFLGLTQLTNLIGFAQGYYLRSFKQEPFLLVSIVIGVLSGVSTFVCGKYGDVTVLAMGYFIINGVIGFIWGCFIFKEKKHAWTGSAIPGYSGNV